MVHLNLADYNEDGAADWCPEDHGGLTYRQAVADPGPGVIYAGRFHPLDEIDDALTRARDRHWPDEEAAVLALLDEGVYLDSLGVEIIGARRERLRLELRGDGFETLDGLASTLTDPFRDEEGRELGDDWVLPDLMGWGTSVVLGGPPKAGKTALVADLAASLLVPGRRFLDYFEPADLDEGEILGRRLLIVNAETPSRAFNRALWSAGVDDRRHPGRQFAPAELASVLHLAERGGPQTFDLTVPEIYARWLVGLTWDSGTAPDRSDDAAPFFVIVDGLTAILGADTARYGEWYARFRELMTAVGVENSLVTAHNVRRGDHLLGGTEAMAGSDGNWSYSMRDPDSPWSPRYFQTSPRIGNGEPLRARVDRTGRGLRIDPATVRRAVDPHDDGADLEELATGPVAALETATGPRVQAGPAVQAQEHLECPGSGNGRGDDAHEGEAEVLAYVAACNGHGHGPSKRETRVNVAARNPEVDAALERLVAIGRLEARRRWSSPW